MKGAKICIRKIVLYLCLWLNKTLVIYVSFHPSIIWSYNITANYIFKEIPRKKIYNLKEASDFHKIYIKKTNTLKTKKLSNKILAFTVKTKISSFPSSIRMSTRKYVIQIPFWKNNWKLLGRLEWKLYERM
jgi:hypothetical protein